MIKILLFIVLYNFIDSVNLYNLTNQYNNSNEFINAFSNNESKNFFSNSMNNLYKSNILDGSQIKNISINFIDNSSIIYVSKLDIFASACTKEYFLGTIDSNLNNINIFNDNNESIFINLKDESKCDLLYYSSNEKHYFVLILIENKLLYIFNFNESTKNLEYKEKVYLVKQDFVYEPYFNLINNKDHFFFSFLVNSDDILSNVIYMSYNISSFDYTKNISLSNIYPIDVILFDNLEIFYGLHLTYDSLFFCIPKYKIKNDLNEIDELTNSNFSIDYDGFIKNETVYKTIKAVYLNESHFILNYLYKENILKVKIIDISNELDIEKKIFDFKLEIPFINPIKTFFNFILSKNSFSYLLSTENEKYYFIISYNNCDSSCGICLESPKEEINNKCIKCSNDHPFTLFEEINNFEFECFDECPFDYKYEIDKNDFICHSKNNTKCSQYYPFKLFEEMNNIEFNCFDKCPNNYGYKIDKNEYICYNKDDDIDNYFWDGENFSPCHINCTKCKNNDKCLECSNNYPFKLFEEIDNIEFKCFDKCPNKYKIDKNNYICYYNNPCFLTLNQLNNFNTNYITYFINQSIECENYIIQCYYYNTENVEKFHKINNSSSILYLNTNNLRQLNEKKLILFKLDIIREDELLNQIEYKLYDENLNEINFNNTQIKISIPISNKKSINEQLNNEYNILTNEKIVWNSSSPFYNDICYAFSENNKDIILEDRKKNYFPYDKKIFDENCEFVSIKDDVIELLCDYKANIITDYRNYTHNKIHEEFNINQTYANFKVLKCPKNKFYKSYLFWICLILFILQIIFILYICKYVIFFENENENENEKHDEKNTNKNALESNDEYKKSDKNNSKDKKNNNKNSFSIVLKYQENLEDSDDYDSNNKVKGISHFKMNLGGELKLKKNKSKNIYLKNSEIIENQSNEEEKNKITNNNNNGLSLKVIDVKKNDHNIENINKKNKIEYSDDINNDEEFKYMNYKENEDSEKINFFEIYIHYIKYNEITLYTFFNNKDFNHKFLKYSLFVFYLDCLILFNIFFFSNKIMSKIYKKNKYPFIYNLGNNFIVVLICFAISFGAKFFISTQNNIISPNKKENINSEKLDYSEKVNDEIKEVSNNFNKDSNNYGKLIKDENKKSLINKEIKEKKCYVIAYFAGVIITYVYTFIHSISFGIIFKNSQKFILLSMFICYIIGIIFSLIFNLISSVLRYYGIKKKNEKLFNLSLFGLQ